MTLPASIHYVAICWKRAWNILTRFDKDDINCAVVAWEDFLPNTEIDN